MGVFEKIYRWWTIVLLAGVLVQIGAAGYGAFYAAKHSDPGPLKKHAFDHGFDFHDGFGYIILYAAVILFALALLARLGKRRILFALAAPLLVVVQVLLALGGEDHPVIGIFHPVNAFLILGLTGSLAFRAWRGGSATG